MGNYPGKLCPPIVIPDFYFQFGNNRSTISCEYDLDHKCIEILHREKMKALIVRYIAGLLPIIRDIFWW